MTFNFLTLLWVNYYRAICSIEVDNYVEIVTKCIIYVWKKNGVRLINNKQVMSAVLQNMVMKPWLFLWLVVSVSNDKKNEAGNPPSVMSPLICKYENKGTFHMFFCLLVSHFVCLFSPIPNDFFNAFGL